MAITRATINDTMIGTVISPFPDGFIAKMTMLKSQSPAWQKEHHLAFPYPRGRWTSGRVVLTELGGAGQRVLNFASQYGALTGGHVLLTNGQSFRFRGDLLLECLPRNQVWEIDFSDVPVVAVAEDTGVIAAMKAAADRIANLRETING
jgi:hypothetical protein